MINATQPELAGIAPNRGRVGRAEVEAFVAFMQGAERSAWTTAAEYLRANGRAVTEDGKRWVRLLRRECAGRVLGGPGFPGYRATKRFTAEEYTHWRNAMLAQSNDMKGSVLQADKEFYARAAV